MEDIGHYLLVAAMLSMGLAFFASMIGYHVEWSSIKQFSPWAFRRGFVVLAEEHVIPISGRQCLSRGIIETRDGSFWFVSSDECLFRSRLGWWRRASPFVTGTILWSGDRAQVTSRVPLFETLVIASGIVVGIACMLVAIVASGNFRWDLAIAMIVAFAAFAATSAISVAQMKRRARDLARQLYYAITSPSEG